MCLEAPFRAVQHSSGTKVRRENGSALLAPLGKRSSAPTGPARSGRPDDRLRTAGERLSFESSILRLPWALIPQDGVEDGEELSRYGDEGDELRLARGDELVPEWLEDWIVMSGDHCSQEQDVADAFATAADEALAPPLAGLAGPGSKADEGSDLTAIERAELRQFSDQGASDDRPDAGDGCEQVLLFSPDRRAAHTIVDLAIEFGEFFLAARTNE